MAKKDTFRIKTDTAVHLTSLKMEDGDYVNDATVTAVLQNVDGQVVNTGGPIQFTYVPNSQGNYDGIIPYTTELTEGEQYDLMVTIIKGSYHMTARIRRKAAYVDE